MSQRPNILFFFTDDQRFDTIHALGNEQISTPNLDWLVAHGTAFTNAYIMGGTSGAVCMPSRAMLWTGRTLFHIQEQGQGIPLEHVMLGEMLQAAGYTVFGTGKWHNGPAAHGRNFNAGAEIFYGGMDDHWNMPVCDFDPAGAYPQRIHQTVDFVTQRVVEKVADHIHAGRHSSVLFCDAAIDFLRDRSSHDPFFIYVGFTAPHDPRTMPRQYLEMYDPERLPLGDNFQPEHPFDNGEMQVRDELLAAYPRDPCEASRHLAAYYGMITHLDAQIGRVLAALRETGQLDNTIIVLAGDNGLALGRHGLMGKQSLYEHSIHVPLLIAGPGIATGQRSDAFVYLIDIYPTLCELIGLPVPGSVEGASFAVSLTADDGERATDAERLAPGRRSSLIGRSHLMFAYRHLMRGVRDERWKLIEYVVEGRRHTQLFDLRADPWELTNLAGDPGHAERLSRLRGLLAEWRDELGDTQADMGKRFWDGYHSQAPIQYSS
ncbi:MAG: sulfatase-like hydrolase/transferase [Anaerolineae bacterium]|nr:sulfatase-like hydrolase/transferase [Anaerolineae bacterium]